MYLRITLKFSILPLSRHEISISVHCYRFVNHWTNMELLNCWEWEKWVDSKTDITFFFNSLYPLPCPQPHHIRFKSHILLSFSGWEASVVKEIYKYLQFGASEQKSWIFRDRYHIDKSFALFPCFIFGKVSIAIN